MEKLIRKYKEECDLSSKLASRIWKIGQIITALIAASYYMKKTNIIVSFIIATIFMIILHIICECIETINIAKKMKIEYNLKEVVIRNKNINKFKSLRFKLNLIDWQRQVEEYGKKANIIIAELKN